MFMLFLFPFGLFPARRVRGHRIPRFFLTVFLIFTEFLLIFTEFLLAHRLFNGSFRRFAMIGFFSVGFRVRLKDIDDQFDKTVLYNYRKRNYRQNKQQSPVG